MNLIKRRENPKYIYLFGLIIFLVLFNPNTLVELDPSPPFSSETYNQILLIDFLISFLLIALILFEFPLLTLIYPSVLIVFVSFSLPFIGLEVFLRSTTLLDQLESPNPSYIPRYLRDQDDKIEKTGNITSEGFRTVESTRSLLDTLKQDKGCKIVVLGDSFVWGAGLEPSKRWPDKLSNNIDCRVYPFGKNGWTSIEQFSFYQQELLNLDFDFLLVGIVENDPHPRGKFLSYSFQPEIYMRTNWGILQLFGLNAFHQTLSNFSYAYDYTSQLFATIITPLIKDNGSMSNLPIVTAGYPAWRDRLYGDDVYIIWENVLKSFIEISRHPLGFVLTPTAGNSSGEKIWVKIESTFVQLNVPYINLYNSAQQAFYGTMRPREFWANGADAHPGDIQTSIYAKGANKLLKDLGYKNKKTN